MPLVDDFGRRKKNMKLLQIQHVEVLAFPYLGVITGSFMISKLIFPQR